MRFFLCSSEPVNYRDTHKQRGRRAMFHAGRQTRLERKAARAFGLKDYAAAIAALEELLNLVGENPNTLHVLAVCRQRRGEEDAAIAAAARGVAADPQHLCCLKVLTEVHTGRGELETARAYAARALALIDAPRPDRRPVKRVLRLLGKVDAPDTTTSGREDRQWARWARALCDAPTGAGVE